MILPALKLGVPGSIWWERKRDEVLIASAPYYFWRNNWSFMYTIIFMLPRYAF